MDKKLLNHEQFIQTEIEKFEHNSKKAETEGEKEFLQEGIVRLYKYHQMNICNFQHERLIHLIVTFSFAGLLLLSIITLFLLALIPVDYNYAVLNNLVLFIIVILFITEIFYVKHYYDLENGAQRLYKLSEKLYKIISSAASLNNDDN